VPRVRKRLKSARGTLTLGEPRPPPPALFDEQRAAPRALACPARGISVFVVHVCQMSYIVMTNIDVL